MIAAAHPDVDTVAHLLLTVMAAYNTAFRRHALRRMLLVNFLKSRKIASKTKWLTQKPAGLVRMCANRHTVLDLKMIAGIGYDVFTHPDHPPSDISAYTIFQT